MDAPELQKLANTLPLTRCYIVEQQIPPIIVLTHSGFGRLGLQHEHSQWFIQGTLCGFPSAVNGTILGIEIGWKGGSKYIEINVKPGWCGVTLIKPHCSGKPIEFIQGMLAKPYIASVEERAYLNKPCAKNKN